MCAWGLLQHTTTQQHSVYWGTQAHVQPCELQQLQSPKQRQAVAHFQHIYVSTLARIHNLSAKLYSSRASCLQEIQYLLDIHLLNCLPDDPSSSTGHVSGNDLL